jgi:ABC-2 type transport system permease protein
MAERVAAAPGNRGGWWALTRYRALQLRNTIDQQLREAPWRSFAAVLLLLLIWLGLFIVLDFGLRQARSSGLRGIVADEHLFVHFFVVLTVMLGFSNAILMFGALYGREEASHLLTMPVDPKQFVAVKWFESVFLSSWSFVLLGIPLMFGVARSGEVEWYYYPLFLIHFLAFVVIPGCLGLLAAGFVAMFAPRRPISAAIGIGTLLLLGAIYWVLHLVQNSSNTDQWVRDMLEQVDVVKQPLLPSTWTAKGIVAAMNHRVDKSLFYLGVVGANALFLAWATVNILAASWPEAFSRANHGRLRTTIRRGWFTEAVNWTFFFYLPFKLRKVMLKDLRFFARDAKQWSQMMIMLGLLVIYALNLKRLPVDADQSYTQSLIAFLNLTTVSLILATFTSRFVYPLLSLESQQLWLIELVPMRRVYFLGVKFLFALTVTAVSACGVMGIAVSMLGVPAIWARINLMICLGVCIGLSGLAIGLGARFPVLHQRNPARIASGFGGTLNLIASMLFVGVEMAGVAYLSIVEFRENWNLPDRLTLKGQLIVMGLLVFSLVVGTTAMVVGARRFNRLEY